MKECNHKNTKVNLQDIKKGMVHITCEDCVFEKSIKAGVEIPRSNCCYKPIGQNPDGSLWCGGSNFGYEGGCGELCDLAPYPDEIHISTSYTAGYQSLGSNYIDIPKEVTTCPNFDEQTNPPTNP